LHVPYDHQSNELAHIHISNFLPCRKETKKEKDIFKINTAISKWSKEKVMLNYCVETKQGITTLILAYEVIHPK
jgi:hypothetical protein